MKENNFHAEHVGQIYFFWWLGWNLIWQIMLDKIIVATGQDRLGTIILLLYFVLQNYSGRVNNCQIFQLMKLKATVTQADLFWRFIIECSSFINLIHLCNIFCKYWANIVMSFNLGYWYILTLLNHFVVNNFGI